MFSLGQSTIGGFVLNDYILYNIISMFIILFIANVEEYFANDVSNGNLIVYILRNVNPMLRYYFFTLGFTTFEIVTIGTILLGATLYYNYFSILNILLFIIFFINAILLNIFVRALFSLFAVKTQRIGGIMSTFFLIVSFLSGSWIPLNLFPQVAQQIFYFLPFQYMRYFPAIVYLGKVNYSQIIFGLLISILWIIAFYFIYKFFYKKAIKYFEAQGG